MAKRFHILALGLSLFTAASCVSVLPEQAVPSGLYRLSGVEPVASLQSDLVVREPTAVRLFSGSGMVTSDGDGALRLIVGVEWAGRATQLMQDGLIDAFSSDGEGTALSDMTGAAGAFELSWRVTDLTIMGNEAVCALSLTLLDGRSRTPLARQELSSTIEVASTSPTVRARALSDAAGECVGLAAQFVAAEIEAAYSAAEMRESDSSDASEG
ncbi:MAG: ABC-type transport auxiliary lipoprotein family protein [Pseudomonadota bacterium]